MVANQCWQVHVFHLISLLFIAMLVVDNDKIETGHDQYSYILYILIVYALYPAMMIDNDYID